MATLAPGGGLSDEASAANKSPARAGTTNKTHATFAKAFISTIVSGRVPDKNFTLLAEFCVRAHPPPGQNSGTIVLPETLHVVVQTTKRQRRSRPGATGPSRVGIDGAPVVSR